MAPKANISKKRKADAAPVAPARAPKRVKADEAVTAPSAETLEVFVCGEGSSGELGLGTARLAKDVKRPRLNPKLASAVQVAAGGMHAIALTNDNKILTWGVNDQGALGRNTEWEGGLRDMDAASDASDDEDEDDNGLNPYESTPTEVDWATSKLPAGTCFTEVAAGDSCSFALTTTGRVYGWGTFRSNEGAMNFRKDVSIQYRPMLIPELKNIVSIRAGADHALALAKNGAVFSWGNGQQNQLGRRIIERIKAEALVPREFGLPKGPKNGIVAIETGAYHSFALSRNGNVYSWGLNNFGETGHTENAGEDDATITNPKIVESLRGKNITHIAGGGHHTLAATADGDCLVWGRTDAGQMGIAQDEIAKLPPDVMIADNQGKPRIILIPQKVTAVQGHVTRVAAGPEHSFAVTREGKAWGWGFNTNYQIGVGQVDDVPIATLVDNTAVRDKKINAVTTGGQYSVFTAPVKEVEMTDAA